MNLWRGAGGLLIANALFATATPPAPAPDVRFAGFYCHAGETVVCLEEPSSGDWRWTAVGGQFLEYRVLACDFAARTVVLSRADRRYVVPLTGRGARDESPPAAVRVAIRENLRLLYVAAVLHARESRERYVTYDDLVGPDKWLVQLPSVAGESYRHLTFRQGEVDEISVTISDGTHVSYACKETLPPSTVGGSAR